MIGIGSERIYFREGRSTITRTCGFQKKLLATHACNVGVICPNHCSYCSTGAMNGYLSVFKELGESPYGRGFAILDLSVPERLGRAQLAGLGPRDMVQLCTLSDAWAPRTADVGRRLLQRILGESRAQVRILSKNAAVVGDFDVVEVFRDRVTVGLSLTAPVAKEHVIKVIEPHASRLSERVEALRIAKGRGLRRYGMLCPLLPGISDGPAEVRELVELCAELEVEDIWAEPVNARGRGLIYTAQDLEAAGFRDEARAVDQVRRRSNWSAYARNLVETVTAAVTELGLFDRLHFILYESPLMDADREALRRRNQKGIVWL